MTEGEVLHWIKELPLGAAVRQSRWLFGLGETLHFIGLCLMVGGLLIVDLRLLGYIRRIPMRAALAFLPFVIVGFLINLATGIEFFVTDPFMYWPNPAFKLKLTLMVHDGEDEGVEPGEHDQSELQLEFRVLRGRPVHVLAQPGIPA